MSAPGLLLSSGFSNVDETHDPAAYVRRLDDTGAHPFWQAVKRHMIALMAVHEGDHLLDIGCGTGADVQALARAVGSSGRVVGVDSSAAMIAEAEKRAAGIDLPVAYYQGDTCHLDFPDGSFDGCRAERVLQHLDKPHLAIAEMVRVARPGARLVMAEPDYGTLTIAGADAAVTRAIVRQRCNHVRSGTIGRRLPEICTDLQLTELTVTLLTVGSTDVTQPGERQLLCKYLAAAQAAGTVSEVEGTTWLTQLDAAGLAGRYRRAVTVFLVKGRKP
jgi:SAM-dependent methyltransferase